MVSTTIGAGLNFLRKFSPAPILAVAFLAVGAVAAQQASPPPPAPATGLIVGQVVDGESGRPIGETVVTLLPSTAQANPITALAAALKVITDANGRFVYYQLAKGRYSIGTSKPGYVSGLYGKNVPRGPGTQLELADGERVTDVRILMWKHAAITGRVVDEAGEPMVGVEIRVRRATLAYGRPGFVSVQFAAITTDDRGVYRVPALDPGNYVVGIAATSTTIPAPMIEDYFRATGTARADLSQALFAAAPTLSSPGSATNQILGDHILQVGGRMPTPPDPRPGESPAVYTAVYYPQASQITDATVITVKGGETRSGIDMALRPASTVRVSGQLEGAEGSVGVATLFLLPVSAAEPTATTAEATATTVSDSRGAFTFWGVPAGQYSLFVMRWPPASSAPVSSQMTVVQGPGGSSARGMVVGGNPEEPKPAYWAQQVLSVGDRPVQGLPVAMRVGLRVSGKVVFEGADPPPRNRIVPFLEPAASWLKPLSVGETTIAADGSFSLPGAPAGPYLLTIPVPTGWYVKSALAGGRDLSDVPFALTEDIKDVAVTISARGATVAGTVHDRNAKADPTAGVIIFPVDSRYWVDFSAYARRIRDGRTERDGTFELSGLPAGEYYVLAGPQSALDWSTPRFFERLSQAATRITLGEGERKTIDLQTAQVR